MFRWRGSSRDPVTNLAILSVVAYVAAVDIALITKGRLPMSPVVRDSRSYKSLWLALSLHLLLSIPRDPLTSLGGLVEARRVLKAS